MKFKSLPHTIEAFQVSHDMKPPQWFVDLVETGMASVTFNHKHERVTLYDNDGLFKYAHVGDWICKRGDTIFILTNDELKRDFTDD